MSQWFESIGFECSNFIKFNNITGDLIAEADNEFFAETLGIYGVNEHQKLKYQISSKLEGSITSQTLFAQGVNFFG